MRTLLGCRLVAVLCVGQLRVLCLNPSPRWNASAVQQILHRLLPSACPPPLLPHPRLSPPRASERMAEGIPPAALRSSIECLKASVRPGSAASLRRSGSAPPTSLSQEAAVWAAQQAEHAGVQRQGSLDPAAAAAYGAEWDGRVGPARRRDHLRGLRKLLSRGRLQ